MPLVSLYLLGPLVAFAAIAGFAAVLRWMFHDRPGRAWPTPTEPPDFGLLEPVTTAADRSAAHRIQALLRQAGIRCTIAELPDGQVQVLVFATDLDRARRAVG